MDSIMIQCTGRFTTTIIHIIVASMILLATIPSYNVVVLAEPADLGTFGSHNDFPQTTYAIKSDEQRMMVDFVYAFINYTYTNGDGKMISISNDQAKYGEGQIKNVGGRLIHLTNEFNHDDHSACTPEIRGTHGDELPMPGIPWIALIRRGNCTFEEKVRHAFIKRAIGVIIYNDRETNVLDKMKILDKDSEYSNNLLIHLFIYIFVFVLFAGFVKHLELSAVGKLQRQKVSVEVCENLMC